MRVKCPRERRALSSECQRSGCNHYCSTGARICGCCRQQLGSFTANKLAMLLRYHKGTSPEFLAAEDAALEQLNAMPPRKPIGYGWPGSPNKWRLA